VKEFDINNLDFDITAAADQLGETGENMAVPFARFYNRLKKEHVDPTTAQRLTLMYAARIFDTGAGK
jgi:hypothetical protein